MKDKRKPIKLLNEHIRETLTDSKPMLKAKRKLQTNYGTKQEQEQRRKKNKQLNNEGVFNRLYYPFK